MENPQVKKLAPSGATPPLTGMESVLVIGMGLLGGSIARRLKKIGYKGSLTGISSKSSIKYALAEQVIDVGLPYESIPECIEGADLVVLCTPISHILNTLKEWKQKPPPFKKGCLVTDVGSTKRIICQQAAAAFEKSQAVFIGSHPMAGSEKNGWQASVSHLFENAPWIYCPSTEIDSPAVDKLKKFAMALGSDPIAMSPERHDELVAHLSHLPQLISTGMASFFLSRIQELQEGLQISGTGFQDMTRLAQSPYSVWKPIFDTNREKIMTALDGCIESLNSLRDKFHLGDLEKEFEEGAQLRQIFFKLIRPKSSRRSDLLVSLPDHPGALESIIRPLSENNLNLVDLEIMKVREDVGGTVRISFQNQNDAEKALKCLLNHSFEARPR